MERRLVVVVPDVHWEGPGPQQTLDNLRHALGRGVVEDSLLGVLVDVKLRVFLGEPDEDIVAAVNIRVLWVPPSFGVLSMSDELIYQYL